MRVNRKMCEGMGMMRKIELTEDEKRAIVEYGLERGKKELLFYGYIVLVGITLGVLWKGVVFWVSFCAIRRYAGGYHADTENRCLCISASAILLAFLTMKYCMWGPVVLLVLQGSCYVIIMFLSPVSNKNRPLDELECKKFRRYARVLATALMAGTLFAYTAGWIYIVMPVAMSFLVIAFSSLAGVCKNRVERIKGKNILQQE